MTRPDYPINQAIALLMSVSPRAPRQRCNAFPDLIRLHRERLGLSLMDVAKACHCAKTHIWDLEQGRSRNPSARLVWMLSQVLGIDPEQCLESAAAHATPEDAQ